MPPNKQTDDIKLFFNMIKQNANAIPNKSAKEKMHKNIKGGDGSDKNNDAVNLDNIPIDVRREAGNSMKDIANGNSNIQKFKLTITENQEITLNDLDNLLSKINNIREKIITNNENDNLNLVLSPNEIKLLATIKIMDDLSDEKSEVKSYIENKIETEKEKGKVNADNLVLVNIVNKMIDGTIRKIDKIVNSQTPTIPFIGLFFQLLIYLWVAFKILSVYKNKIKNNPIVKIIYYGISFILFYIYKIFFCLINTKVGKLFLIALFIHLYRTNNKIAEFIVNGIITLTRIVDKNIGVSVYIQECFTAVELYITNNINRLLNSPQLKIFIASIVSMFYSDFLKRLLESNEMQEILTNNLKEAFANTTPEILYAVRDAVANTTPEIMYSVHDVIVRNNAQIASQVAFNNVQSNVINSLTPYALNAATSLIANYFGITDISTLRLTNNGGKGGITKRKRYNKHCATMKYNKY